MKSSIIRRVTSSHQKARLPAQSILGGYLPSTPVPGSNRQRNSPVCIESRRHYRVTRKNDSALIVGGIGVLAAAVGGQYVMTAYNQYAEKKAATILKGGDAAENGEAKTASDGSKEESTASTFSSTWFAKNFYDGGFDEKMTKREAALILGIRESASVDRIKEAYRKLLPINHPDKGGSAYLSVKINEAKDLLLKGK
jgi:DnaJ family protein C protein 19